MDRSVNGGRQFGPYGQELFEDHAGQLAGGGALVRRLGDRRNPRVGWADLSARIGRNDKPGVLFSAVVTGALSERELRRGIEDTWTTCEWPGRSASRGVRAAFRARWRRRGALLARDRTARPGTATGHGAPVPSGGRRASDGAVVDGEFRACALVRDPPGWDRRSRPSDLRDYGSAGGRACDVSRHPPRTRVRHRHRTHRPHHARHRRGASPGFPFEASAGADRVEENVRRHPTTRERAGADAGIPQTLHEIHNGLTFTRKHFDVAGPVWLVLRE